MSLQDRSTGPVVKSHVPCYDPGARRTLPVEYQLMSPSRMSEFDRGARRIRPILLWPVLALAVACSQPPEPPPRQPMVRFIELDPIERFALEDLLVGRTMTRFDLLDADEAAQWSDDPPERSGTALPFRTGTNRLVLSRSVDLDAAAIHRVDVEMSVDRRAHVKLRWFRSDDDTTLAGELRLDVAQPGAGKVWYRFPVDTHPEWRGQVGRLELVVGAVNGTARLSTVETVTFEADPERAESALGMPWKVELGHEVRSAIPTRPGAVGPTLAVYVRDDSALRMAIGLPPGARTPLRFRVEVGPERAPTEVWTRTLDPAAEGVPDLWHDVEVPLSAWAGEEVEVRLRVDSGGEFDPIRDLAYFAHPSVVWTAAGRRRPDVYLISIDTLRADRLSLYGYDKRTSPRIDSWARRRGVMFRNAVAAAPWTLPSHWSMMTGLDAVRHGRNHDTGTVRNVGSSIRTLAEILRDQGYATGAFTGGGYLHPRYGFDAGFDAYGYWPNRGRSKAELMSGVERMLAWTEAHQGSPRFFFWHTYTVHDPYRAWHPFIRTVAPRDVAWDRQVVVPRQAPRADHRTSLHFAILDRTDGQSERRATEADRPLIDALYDSGVARADFAIGRLFHQLSQRGDLQNALVILTSDHGEALGEHGRFGHVDLYDANVLVPLIIWFPDRRSAGETIEEQVRSIDLVPTVLDVLDLPPAAGVDGVSLAPLVAGDESGVPAEAWTYSSRAGRGLGLRLGNGLKYIFPNNPWSPDQPIELYDLRRDPFEVQTRLDESPTTDAGLEDRARAYMTERSRGLRLRIRNERGGVVTGRILGDAIRAGGTKSVDAACGCLHWDRATGLSFEVAPASEVSIDFEVVFGPVLRLAGERRGPDGVAPFRHTFRIRGGRDAQALRLIDGRWTDKGRVSGPPDATISVGWQGSATVDAPSPSAIDPELRKQLEALGYGG